jgi:hypothetical protein
VTIAPPLENLLSLRFLIPVLIYCYRLVMESLVIHNGLSQRFWKTGPDLCFMAAILSAFNIIGNNTGFCKLVDNLGNPDAWKAIYVTVYAILWFICLGSYRKMENLIMNKVCTNRAYIGGIVLFVCSFVIGGTLLLTACRLQ